jgi:hypothetical protein
MATTTPLAAGDRVCVVGWGTAGMLHQHTVVARLTKTLIVTTKGRRFRRDTLRSVPYQPYGGSVLSPTCQRPTPARLSQPEENKP